MDELTLTNK